MGPILEAFFEQRCANPSTPGAFLDQTSREADLHRVEVCQNATWESRTFANCLEVDFVQSIIGETGQAKVSFVLLVPTLKRIKIYVTI